MGSLNPDLQPSDLSASPRAAALEKANVVPALPSPQDSMERTHEAHFRALPKLRSNSSSRHASASPLRKIDTLPVTEKVHLLLDKSVSVSDVNEQFSPTTAATSQVDYSVTPSSLNCTSKLPSPQSQRRTKVPIMRCVKSRLGSSQLSKQFKGISSQQSSKSSQNEAIAGPSKTELPCSKRTSLPQNFPMKASLYKSINSGNCLAAGHTCVICFSKPKEASIVHGKTGHQLCCYKCARRLRRQRKPCPVCRRPIQAIIKNFVL